MIGYVTLGTNDLPRAAAFYDAIGAELGVRRFMERESFISWGNPGGVGIMITKPRREGGQCGQWRDGCLCCA
jgi:catechol 2,3-dioxygenase-like lactoylglutathione lyase family enzyme